MQTVYEAVSSCQTRYREGVMTIRRPTVSWNDDQITSVNSNSNDYIILCAAVIPAEDR